MHCSECLHSLSILFRLRWVFPYTCIVYIYTVTPSDKRKTQTKSETVEGEALNANIKHLCNCLFVIQTLYICLCDLGFRKENVISRWVGHGKVIFSQFHAIDVVVVFFIIMRIVARELSSAHTHSPPPHRSKRKQSSAYIRNKWDKNTTVSDV